MSGDRRRKVTDADVRQVLWYRRQQLSLAAISRVMRLSYTTVHEIASGKYRTESAELRARSERCPGCGGLIYQTPCVLCMARVHRAAAKRPHSPR